MTTLGLARRVALALCAILPSNAAPAQDAIPPGLRDWQGWVLKGEDFRRCPFLSSQAYPGQSLAPGSFRCVWPDRLALTVDARGGTFTQRWQVYAESWVELPGNSEHWPRDVKLNGAPAAVVAVGETPTLRLGPGSHTLSGRFSWNSRPESLPLPASTAIVDLSVDGQRVSQPERPGGAVWLGKRRSTEEPAAMEVQVYRLVQDEIPTYLQTRIRLNVAGDAREELLARVLPEGFTATALSGGLPARLERDGRLRVQVRAGMHEITLSARGTSVADALARPVPGEGKWPREEIWSFAANDSLRVAAAEGADGIDPAQANVPPEWRQLPAFRMPVDAKLTVVERSRGLANTDANRLSLARNLWLDFDHEGYTAVDRIVGTMRRDWRLDMRAPFRLASARQGADQLLVTESANGGGGVELRRPRVDLETIARKTSGGGGMPATGWNERFDRVSGIVHLPPGHRLIAAIGADAAPGSWWESWGLWNVFGVLIVVVFVYWAAGVVPAAVAALALLLTYQEAPAYIWLWGNLLAALAIARAAPEGRFRNFARRYRTVSFVVLAIALLPFLWMQVRFALYPQLEGPSRTQRIFMDRNVDNPYGLESLWDGPSLNPFASKQVAQPAPPPIEADIAEESLAHDEAVAAAANASDAATDAAAAATDAAGVATDAAAAIPQAINIPGQRTRTPDASHGLNSIQVVQRYAAGTILQAGPGRPAWTYSSYNYYWSGPVEATDTVRFLYVGPVTMFFWRLIGVIALIALFGYLAALSFDGPKPGGSWLSRLPGMPRAAAGWLAPVLLLGMFAMSGNAFAQGPAAPDSALLTELKSRLTEAPTCAPNCAEITAARVTVDGDRLDVVLQVSALATLAVAMPHASDRWQLDEVSVDARASLAVGRESDSSLWVPLTAGAHTVRLSGRLASAESVQLAFPQVPRTIDVSARGWTANGVNEGRLVSGSLELARIKDTRTAGAQLSAGSEFPAFVRVVRQFNLDLDWTLDTRVSRIAPDRAAISVEVPLVSGESVLTPGIEVRNGTALVGLSSGQSNLAWHSGLARAETLEITLPADAPRSEDWSFSVNPQWNVSFSGFPAVLPRSIDGQNWVFRFIPRPGEKLALTITRPKGMKGTTLAIDSVSREVSVGQRSSNTTLAFEFRSTQGGRHVLKLPLDARVTSVKFDGQSQPVRPEKGELPLSLTPGAHRFEISWEDSIDVALRTRPPLVDLGSPASNVTTSVEMPDSRWVLFASGPGVGPAVLYWGELVVFIGMAWLLSRWSRSPLRFTEWLLLGLGLSTQSWFVFALTAAWLLVMRWRENWQPTAGLARWRFNTLQVLLALFTVIAISTLVFSGIRNGLLARPDMGIQSVNHYGESLHWFQDQVSGAVEEVSIWSVPMWVYRWVMLAWALWMAFALVRWLRWAFNAWKTNGLWR
ncbi:MAG: hypothetical protein H7Y89_19490 [Steroidobacteraceae bacterium]|nr:hypothetical protein [Steroidobacteraceae bacterium]